MSALYLVGTPIGNLSDLSPRALEVLSSVDFIAAEDTRVTLKLLNRFEIQKPLVSYYDRQKNRRSRAESIISRIEAGESCALVTDAGMPAISDPGEELVVLCAERGVEVTAIPGPSAVVTALALSALPTAKWCFEGFLPAEKSDRRKALAELKSERRTMIFYEAPHRLTKTLADMEAAFGSQRRISICRELTKLHEEIIRVTLTEAIAHYDAAEPRGEYVLVVEGSSGALKVTLSEEDAVTLAKELMAGGLSPAAAAKQAAKEAGVPKNAIYRALVNE
ncbi:MAG: 16S rRNA (cytidine(1402)-2'-O)-methyltransferase [Oscillospiraceae bacterium]|nr:16S rRNA (cytidine(1402)-2'-O)-methyltransferase [Oscillospiraceae bacterium]